MEAYIVEVATQVVQEDTIREVQEGTVQVVEEDTIQVVREGTSQVGLGTIQEEASYLAILAYLVAMDSLVAVGTSLAGHIQDIAVPALAFEACELGQKRPRCCEDVLQSHLLVLLQYTLEVLENRRAFHPFHQHQSTFLCSFES